ncbi:MULTISPECIES: hypothetical protein [Pirellulaceae]|uniref:hypothetical protein n=1 Tax=Pirellulaceae TaxID=2691357 RepID=UPI0011B03D7A|nr:MULTISPECIES: hypothetical protein [Pirellulaceae]
MRRKLVSGKGRFVEAGLDGEAWQTTMKEGVHASKNGNAVVAASVLSKLKRETSDGGTLSWQ